MRYNHLRFMSKVKGFDRKEQINSLKKLGVTTLKSAFPGTDHPDRSTVYIIGMPEGADSTLLEEYLAGNQWVLPVTAEDLIELENAPYPVYEKSTNRHKLVKEDDE